MSLRELVPCTECGARPKALDDRFCAFCGAELPRAEPGPARPSAERSARFAMARSLPGFQDAMQREPNATHIVAGGACTVVFLIFFAIVALGIGGVGCSIGGHMPSSGPPMGLFLVIPIAMALFALVAAVQAGGKSVRVATATTERRLALVRDERIRVSGGGKNSSASTSYFVTLEYENGEREEHLVDSRAASRVSPGDVGVAYERGGVLVDFTRLDA